MPRARVIVTSLEENIPREAVTDEQGNYQALNLKAGAYTVSAEAPGFKRFQQAGLHLDARQTLRINLTLEVGAVTEQVTIEAQASAINTETQTIAARFDSKQVLGLPINYRGAGSTSPLRALAYLPGIQADNSNRFSPQGALPHQTEISVDGISTVSVRSNGPLGEMFPSVETIAEMKVQAVGNNAEYGQVGDITTTSRGGSNQFHGAAFNYLQNAALDAKAFGSAIKPQKSANTYGGALGGRIVPNRTFFHTAFERMEFRRGTTVSNTVPTQLMRNGDVTGEGLNIRDPLNNNAPFAGGKLPASRISPIAAKFLEYYPLPNFGSTIKQASSNFRENRAAPVKSWQYDIRIDHSLTSKQSLFGRFSYKSVTEVVPNSLSLPADDSTNKGKNLVLSHNYTISPRLLNEFRLGFVNSDVYRFYNFDGKAIIGGVGFQGLGPFPFNGLTGLNFSGATTNFGKSKPPFTVSRNFQFNNNTTWIHGRHTAKFGFDARRLRTAADLNFFGQDDYGRFSFDGRYSGDYFTDYLLGLPYLSQLAQTGFDVNGTSWHYSLFAQDSFKVSQKLTLEYGLRWEYHPPFTDAAFNITNFDRSVPQTGRVIIPTDPQASKVTAPGFLLGINACPGNPAPFGAPCTPFLTAQQAGYPEYLRFADRNDFNPRLGFAFRPFNDTRTVIRGGFGLYTMTVLGNIFYSLTGVHGSDIREFTNSVSNSQFAYRWPQVSTGGSGVGTPVYGNAYFGTAVQPSFKDPYMMQYSLTVERELPWNTGFRVSYIGNRSVQLPWSPDLNQPALSTAPFNSRPLTDRPFPYWGRIYSRDSGGSGVYGAMQTEFSKRYGNGLTFNTAWTWSKNLSDAAGGSNDFSSDNGGGRNANSLDRRADRGNVGPTRRHRWITTAMYDLPFGRGKQFLSNAHPVLNGIAGGWRISGILLAQTGPFLTPLFTGGDPSGTNAPVRGSMRPDVLFDPHLDNPTATRFWDRSAFVCPGRTAGSTQFSCNVPPIGRFGNAAAGSLVGPGTVNLNFGFAKDFRVTEQVQLSFEGSFTNLPNHPNLSDPGTTVTSIAFGTTTSARGADSGGNRVGQFALRLKF